MTEKCFWEDPYRTRLDTVIASVDGNVVTLKQTIFFAFSGGQESDTGFIGGLPVQDAFMEGREIFYTMPPGHGLTPGSPVSVSIDWARRYRLMRLHFAAEVVLELLYARFNGMQRTGAHIAVNKARIDFVWPLSIAPLLPEIQAAAQAVIDGNQPIISDYSDRATERRFWEVPGFAKVPCGGTHLRRTGEVGTIALKRKNPGRGMERVEIHLVD